MNKYTQHKKPSVKALTISKANHSREGATLIKYTINLKLSIEEGTKLYPSIIWLWAKGSWEFVIWMDNFQMLKNPKCVVVTEKLSDSTVA